MQQLNYDELNISIVLGPKEDSTSDVVSFRLPNGKLASLHNSLTHQPQNILSLGASMGVKPSGRSDFTLIKFTKDCTAGAVFTKNLCRSITIERNLKCLQSGPPKALAVISGNAITLAPHDAEDLDEVSALISSELLLSKEQLLISATGKIGEPLNIAPFQERLPGISSKLKDYNLDSAASAILTTDRGPKCSSFRYGELILCGFCKGAGMIEPNMATMLAYFFTNAKLPTSLLQTMLKESVNVSFNRMSIDTDTSTSDSAFLFSCGEHEINDEELSILRQALKTMCVKFSRDICSTAEGAQKAIEVLVSSDWSEEESQITAKHIVNSPLVKTAIHGADPNWGRIGAALGKPTYGLAARKLDITSLQISICNTVVFDSGKAVQFDRSNLSEQMQINKVIPIDVKIGKGQFPVRVWGCDLSEEYVRFNSEYTT